MVNIEKFDSVLGKYVGRPVCAYIKPNHAKPVRITCMSSQIYGYCFWRVFGTR